MEVHESSRHLTRYKLPACMIDITSNAAKNIGTHVPTSSWNFKTSLFFFFFFIYIFLGFTDHSRPPLSRAVPNRRSPPLRTLSAGQQNGARFYNKAMSSEMPFQVPHNWVGTTPQDADTHYSIHVVAHKDSSRFTLPPPHVEFARLSLKPLCWALRQALSSVAIG